MALQVSSLSNPTKDERVLGTEFLTWAGLFGAAVVVLWSAWRGRPIFAVATATFLIGLLAWLERAGIVRLCGPVLGYDMVRTARRKQFILLRCFYGVFLLIAFFLVY